jgi:hypothetical protein
MPHTASLFCVAAVISAEARLSPAFAYLVKHLRNFFAASRCLLRDQCFTREATRTT